MPPRVGVFLDYQNVHLSARDRFSSRASRPESSLVHPVRIAELIVDRRRPGGDLSGVRVYRGRPSPSRQPRMTAANDAQTAEWSRDPRVTVVRRDLRYVGWPQVPPREKGIDVALAVDLIRASVLGWFETVIVFSADTDLLPALEAVFDHSGAHVEVASWEGVRPLWFPGMVRRQKHLPYCHFLDEKDFEEVRDRRKYV